MTKHTELLLINRFKMPHFVQMAQQWK